jgi:hypothetical protein
MTRPYEIYVAYIAWSGGGKARPVLVIGRRDAVVFVFPITTQYENKSPAVRGKYFKIDDWEFAGLDRPSYADTNAVMDLPSAALRGRSPIGMLSERDKARLLAFMSP